MGTTLVSVTSRYCDVSEVVFNFFFLFIVLVLNFSSTEVILSCLLQSTVNIFIALFLLSPNCLKALILLVI